MRGFTLLEVVVVLALMALALGIVVPRLDVFTDSIAAAHERETIIEGIAALGLTARQNGQVIVFSGQTEPLPVQVPQGWSISVADPIRFYSSGACSGGVVILQSGSRRFMYRLEAPRCRATLVD